MSKLDRKNWLGAERRRRVPETKSRNYPRPINCENPAIKTCRQFDDYVRRRKYPLLMLVHPDDYAVITIKFVHRHDVGWDDQFGGFCVKGYWQGYFKRTRVIVIRPSWDATRIPCEG